MTRWSRRCCISSTRRAFDLVSGEIVQHEVAAILMRQTVQAMAKDIDGRLREHQLTLVQRRALTPLSGGQVVTPRDVSLALEVDTQPDALVWQHGGLVAHRRGHPQSRAQLGGQHSRRRAAYSADGCVTEAIPMSRFLIAI